MKMPLKLAIILILSAAVMSFAASQNAPQAKVDNNKVVGNWSLEVNAGSEFYYLPLMLNVTEGKLGGTLSEVNGFFKDVLLTAVEFDGTLLKFEAKTPTPPDGEERTIKFELKLAADKLEGQVIITDLGMSVPVTGAKK